MGRRSWQEKEKADRQKLREEQARGKLQALADHGHRKLVSRRDFVSHGLAAGFSTIFVPTLLGHILRSSEAYAASTACPQVGASAGLLPFLSFDCGGGAALAGNWVPRDAGLQNLTATSYGRMGLGSTAAPPMDFRFGAPMSTRGGVILQEMLNNMSATTIANLRMGFVASQSLSDNGTGQHNAVMEVAKAGYVGQLMPNLLGTGGNAFGGSSQGPRSDSVFRAVKVGSPNDVVQALSLGQAFNGMSAAAKQAVTKATLGLTQAQQAKFSAMTLGQQLGELAGCGFSKNIDVAGGGALDVDPRQNATAQAVYTDMSTNSGELRKATVAYNVLKNNSSSGTIEIQGCDYHPGSKLADVIKADTEIGRSIGRACELAARMGKGLVFQVLTDGGLDSKGGRFVGDGQTTVDSKGAIDDNPWSSDSNGQSGMVIGVLLPPGQGAIQFKKLNGLDKTQVGAYKNNVADDTKFFSPTSAQNIQGYLVLLNYLVASLGEAAGIAQFVASVPQRIRDLFTDGGGSQAKIQEALFFQK